MAAAQRWKGAGPLSAADSLKLLEWSFAGRSMPVVHLLWEQADRVQFSAARLKEVLETRLTNSSPFGYAADGFEVGLG